MASRGEQALSPETPPNKITAGRTTYIYIINYGVQYLISASLLNNKEWEKKENVDEDDNTGIASVIMLSNRYICNMNVIKVRVGVMCTYSHTLPQCYNALFCCLA